jgi:hypothetical protein
LLGVAIFISITSLVPVSLSKPGRGNGKGKQRLDQLPLLFS